MKEAYVSLLEVQHLPQQLLVRNLTQTLRAATGFGLLGKRSQLRLCCGYDLCCACCPYLAWQMLLLSLVLYLQQSMMGGPMNGKEGGSSSLAPSLEECAGGLAAGENDPFRVLSVEV